MDGLVLSHPEQLERLWRVCPEAVDVSVLAGDPCFDRMLAARPYRDRFRRALGVRRGQRLVVLNSTWNPEGFFGSGSGSGNRGRDADNDNDNSGDRDDLFPSLLPRLTAELPADDYRFAAVLHPNIWYGHGPGQVRAWLDRARRAGLTLIDPAHAWRQALLAADAVIGDFGAVSYYAAALGLPVSLAATGEQRLDPETPLAAFVRDAPRIDPHGPLRAQVEQLFAGHRRTAAPTSSAASAATSPPVNSAMDPATPSTAPAEFVTSSPGSSAALLRRHFYALMDLPEPASPALLEPLPLPPYDPPRRTAPLRVLTRVDGADVVIERSTELAYDADGDVHLAVHEETRDPGTLESADVIVGDGAPDDPRLGGPEVWAAEVLQRHAHCSVAAYVGGPDVCTVRSREHGLFRLSAGPGADADPAAYASSLYAWLTAGGSVPPGGVTLHVHVAGGIHPVTVEPFPAPLDGGTGPLRRGPLRRDA
ncbi:hypothetical protein AB0C93_12230 [Streptomyces sp. NPDC048518]|uniref:hypothetical protein n=1 Tax=Streptomyces sp. NPDC048518 TaxID=3155029 RepID=UPI0033DFB642